MTNKNKIEVYFSPIIFALFKEEKSIVVVVDVLRATSAICTAFMNGAKELIPVATVEEAREYKNKGYLVAGERDGKKLDFADFGNSPFNFTAENVKSKTVVYTTTNGTQAVELAKLCYKTVIGSFLNLKAVCDWLFKQNRDITILCAGWKNKFSLEDAVLAGAYVAHLLKNGNYYTICDSALCAQDLWQIAKGNLVEYINKCAQKERLRKLGLDDVIEYCLTLNITDIIPVLKGGRIVKL